METDRHKLLKERATKWLRSRGCTDIRYEVAYMKVRIDVVGFRGGEPVIGIECGNIYGRSGEYKNLSFPIFHLPFEALLSKSADDGDDSNLAGCKPVHLFQIYVNWELPIRR